MNKGKIIERIRKLLAMAADASSPNEAVIAAKRARALMDKHQIEQSDVGEQDDFGTSMLDSLSFKKVPLWVQSLAIAVAQLNDCLVVLQKNHGTGHKKFLFRGFESDVIIATHMLDYLVGAINALAAQRDLRGRSAYYQYKMSAMNVVRDRIDDLILARRNGFKNSSGTALVPMKMAMVEEEFGKAKYHKQHARQPTNDEMDAYLKGAKDGAAIQLNKFVNGEAKEKLG